MGIFTDLLFGIFERSDTAKELEEDFLVNQLISLQNDYYLEYKAKKYTRSINIFEQHLSKRKYLETFFFDYEDDPVKSWLSKNTDKDISEELVFACTDAEKIAYYWQEERKKGLPIFSKPKKKLLEAEKQFEKKCRENNVPLLDLSAEYFWRKNE